MNQAVLQTSVGQLVEAFREALVAVSPVMLKVRILNLQLEGYDDWDEIEEALFSKIVVESIRYALPEAERTQFAVPKVSMVYQDYSAFSFIEVIPKAGRHGDERLAFFGFESTQGKPAMDCKDIVAYSLGSGDQSLGRKTVFQWDAVEFKCSYLHRGSRTLLDRLEVEL